MSSALLLVGFSLYAEENGAAAQTQDTPPSQNVAQREDVQMFIADMVEKHQFEHDALQNVFSKVQIDDGIIKAITRPAENKPWYEYRAIFVTDSRINLGVKFWNDNADSLAKAYAQYGVPPEIVVAIIGVETRYGEHKGKYPIMDSLTTLAFDFPKRGKFFRGELEQFLLLTREENVDPLSLKGSYAGAMGKPQFIASSYRSYAVDFDGDGKRDILNSSVDAIGSVANYFNRHNWQKDQPIAGKSRVKGKKYRVIVKKGIKPNMTLRDMARKGVHVEGKYPPDQLAALIEFKKKKGREYWVGFNNFYAITRYNHSELYAMAVYQLSQAIVKKRNALQAQQQTKSGINTSATYD